MANDFTFSDVDWAAIEATLPEGCHPALLRNKLEEEVRGFKNLENIHARWGSKSSLTNWKAIVDRLSELEVLTKQVGYTDPNWRAALAEFQNTAKDYYEAYEMHRRAYRGRQNPARMFFYWRVLDFWRNDLEQPLGASTSESGVVGGPLVLFFNAVMRPVLSEHCPRPHTVREIIRREQAMRRTGRGRSRRQVKKVARH